MPRPTKLPIPVPRKGTMSPPEYADNAYAGLIMPQPTQVIEGASEPLKHRFMIGIPSTGTVRIEWAMARYCQIIPTNWSAIDCYQWLQQATPLNYNVADARNVIAHIAITQNFSWLFFLDSDVILPPDAFLKLNAYMRQDDIPVVFGLYFTKSDPAEPLVYRGRGNSYFAKFTLGEQFWVDGIGMGLTLIKVDVLRAMANDAPLYMAGGSQQVKKIFDTPQVVWTDPETSSVRTYQGTEDLSWCTRVMEGGYLAKAGYPKIQARKWPFLCDSSLVAMHISPDGTKYPLRWVW